MSSQTVLSHLFETFWELLLTWPNVPDLFFELNAVLHIQFCDTFDSNRLTEWLQIITRFVLQIQIPFSIDDVESVKDNIAALVIFPQTPILSWHKVHSLFSLLAAPWPLSWSVLAHMRSHHSGTQSKKVSRSRKKKYTFVTRDYLYSCQTFFFLHMRYQINWIASQINCSPFSLWVWKVVAHAVVLLRSRSQVSWLKHFILTILPLGSITVYLQYFRAACST